MNLILDLLFPKRCVNCRKFGSFFCLACQNKLQSASDICPICERIAFYGLTHPGCKSKYTLDRLTSAFLYNRQIKNVIHWFKYRPYITELTPTLGKLLTDSVKSKKGLSLFIKQKPTLIPIPLHFWRKHIRGYNQTELLVQDLAKRLQLPWINILIRTKHTKSQSELDFRQRQKNVSGIFTTNSQIKLPKNVILVDDVWTTGATIKSACRELKIKGVKSVWALTLAR